MPNIARLWIAVFTATMATAAGPGFLLGVDYSQRIGFGTPYANSNPMMATDGTGALYLLDLGDPRTLPASAVLGSPETPASYVMKLSTAGDRIVYLTVLEFRASALAVDSSGSVYLTGPGVVAKLNATGTALVYRMPMAEGLEVDGLAVDGSGRAYVTGRVSTGNFKTTANAFQQTAPSDNRSKGFVAKVNTAGTAFDFATYLAGNGWDIPMGIAVDGSGAAVVAGTTTSTDFPVTPGAYITDRTRIEASLPFLARLSADGSKLIYSTFAGDALGEAQAVAVDRSGNAAVYRRSLSGLAVLHFNPQGTAVTFSATLPLDGLSLPSLGLARRSGRALAMDAAGNTYVTAIGSDANSPVKNSLVPCEPVYLTVLGPTGDVLQSTYLAGGSGTFYSSTALALGPNSTVFVAGTAAAAFVPTREIGAAGGPLFLTRLSPNGTVQPVKLACVGNAGSYDPGPVAPGEIVSLFGEGLGPVQGMQPAVEVTSGFPTMLGGVQVTFDQMPAPLLYVQDSQINAIAPWSLTEGRTTQICVSVNQVKTNCLSRSVANASPGVFTVDGRYAAALNQDGSLNSAANPAPWGSIVSIFATGLGRISPSLIDGAIVGLPLPIHVLPVRLGIPGGSAIAQSVEIVEPQYAGPAPFQVAGVSQINFPATASPVFLAVGRDFFFDSVRSRTFLIHVK